jgi:hypothetical protein
VTLSIENVSIENVSIEGSWAAVCPVGDVPVGAGVAALLDDNVQWRGGTGARDPR